MSLLSVAAHGDLRLRLEDAKQVRRTTSVNWWDLSERRKQPRKSLVPAVQTPQRILLDPGHGGHDLGAVGWFHILEKKLALRIAAAVKQELIKRSRASGVVLDVRLTRDDDTFIPLKERVAIANAWEADLFVSIHANASESSKARGFEIYFLDSQASDEHTRRVAKAENKETGSAAVSPIESILRDLQTTLHINQSSRFAESVYSAMSKHVRPNVRGVRQGPFTVLEGTQMPAVLIEVGYLTHRQEAKKLLERNYQTQVVRAISSALLEVTSQRKKLVHGSPKSSPAT